MLLATLFAFYRRRKLAAISLLRRPEYSCSSITLHVIRRAMIRADGLQSAFGFKAVPFH